MLLVGSMAEELVAESAACDPVVYVYGASHGHGDVACVIRHAPDSRSSVSQGELHRSNQTKAAVARLG